MADKIGVKPESVIEQPNAGATRDFIFVTLIDAMINASTASKNVNVGGFRKYSILGRFEGKASAKIRFEVYNNNFSVATEVFNLGSGGWFTFTKVYDVFAPNVNVVIYEFPANLKAKIYLYAGY